MCLVATGLSLRAQNMPKEGYSGLGFNITGLSSIALSNYGNGILNNATLQDPTGVLTGGFNVTVGEVIPQNMLMYKRYYGGGWASRLSLGINSISSTTSNGDSTETPLEYSDETTKVSGFSFGIGLGMEKHIETDAAKVDPYLGADLMIGLLGGIDYSYTQDVTGDGYSTNTQYDVAYPGGFGAGLNLLGGFNYFFSDNISIGGEVGMGFGMVKTGGDWTSDYTFSSTVGGTTTTSTSNDQGTYENKQMGIQVNSYGGVNLIVYW